MPSAGLPARAAALSLISGVTLHGRLLSELLPKTVEHLPEGDRARAQRLASDTLRWMDRADRALGPFLRSRPTDRALNILRLGAVELAHDPGSAHGIVSDAVDLAGASPETKRQSRFGSTLYYARSRRQGRRGGPGCRCRACRSGCASRCWPIMAAPPWRRSRLPIRRALLWM